MTTVGIVAQNSAGWLAAAFEHMNAGHVIVALRNPGDRERIEAAGVQQVVTPGGESGWVRAPRYAPSDDAAIRQIVFSSGTEGRPKAVALSGAALANTTERLIAVMQMEAGVREYVGVPIFYSFGFARCRVAGRLGGDLYIPPHGFDPVEIAALLERGEINAISAVPSLWRLLLQSRELYRRSGPRLRWIEIGSQYMSGEEKAQLKHLFPEARIVQHYGLTEASRTTFLKVHEAEGARLESVGQATHGIEVALDATGRVRVRGPHLASGLLEGGRLVPLTDAAGWFTTGDLGRIDGADLYYEGRADDLINCGGVKLSPDALERGLFERLGAARGLCVAKAKDDLRGEVVLIGHESSIEAGRLRRAAVEVLREHGLEAGSSVRLFALPSLPVTETGKPRRRAVTQLYEEAQKAAPAAAAAPPPAPAVGQDDQMAAIARVWEDVLQVRPVSVNDSFFELGGDSLSALTVAMRMEALGVPHHVSRQIFQGKSIAEIVAGGRPTGRRTPLAAANQTINIVRGVLALLVFFGHSMPGVVEHLPASLAAYNVYLSPLYSSGTAGFALIFGIGVGFGYLPRYLRSADSLSRLVRRNALLLAGGILCVGAAKITANLVSGRPMTPVDVSNAFWGVLVYYLLAVLSIPLWLRWLSRRRDLWMACAGAALGLYVVHLLFEAYPPAPSQNPFAQTLILILTTKFNYFEMTAGVMLGLPVGVWLRRATAEPAAIARLVPIGVLLMASSVALSAEMNELPLWLVWPKGLYLWMWPCYAGAVLILVALVHRHVAAGVDGRWTGMFWNVLAVTGLLAFPLFIGQDFLLPLRDVLVAAGAPKGLLISVLLFFAAWTYLTVRVYRVYFAGTPQPDARAGLDDIFADRKAH
ncbi:MAG TPA: AMP-binding protein [Burkholderiales bacterium]|nr:AMP-binding protein [Burkholderiales bacterium]